MFLFISVNHLWVRLGEALVRYVMMFILDKTFRVDIVRGRRGVGNGFVFSWLNYGCD